MSETQHSSDDFADIDLDHHMNHEPDPHEPDEDDEHEPPPRASRQAATAEKKSLPIRKIAIGMGIFAIIAGGVYGSWTYVASTYLTPKVNVANHKIALGGNHPANRAPNEPAGFPSGNGFPVAPAADQNAAQTMPPIERTVGNTETPSLPGQTQTGANGFPSSGPAPVQPVPVPVPPPAPAAPPGMDQDSLITVLNSHVVDVLNSHGDDNTKAVQDSIQTATSDVKSDVDSRSREIEGRIDQLQATEAQIKESETEIAAKLDAMTMKPTPEDSAEKTAKAGKANSVHHPVKHVHVTHPEKASTPPAPPAPPGWHLRGVGNGYVVLLKDDHYTPVLIGKQLPDGSATVEGVTKKDGKYEVRTSAGLIQE